MNNTHKMYFNGFLFFSQVQDSKHTRTYTWHTATNSPKKKETNKKFQQKTAIEKRNKENHSFHSHEL